MGNRLGRFDYEILGGTEKIPVTPLAHITLQHSSTLKSGRIAISATLTTSEVDGYIELLKADLDAVGAKAKRALEKTHQKNLAMIKSKQEED
jgi:hypothetical protein